MPHNTKSKETVSSYLEKQEQKTLLRFITCGSVDDGKSTLIGRLLYDSKLLFEDHVSALESDSRRFGTQGDSIDYALLLDGLDAEREQGITIDVAYRFFDTDKHKYIVADCPGHEQYTRNMVTGASTADVALVLVDASKGLLSQTKRHTQIVSLLGIKIVVLVINKMDLVNYSSDVFDHIAAEYHKLVESLGVQTLQIIPVSALKGDNVFKRSEYTPYYQGPTLMEFLESTEVFVDLKDRPSRVSVQYVIRSSQHFRGYSGTIAQGSFSVGDKVSILPTKKSTSISKIFRSGNESSLVMAGDAAVICLEEEIDISRGDMIVSSFSEHPKITSKFTANIVWLDESILRSGQEYRLKIGTKTINATVDKIYPGINPVNQKGINTERVSLNDITKCSIRTNSPIVLESYAQNRTLGSFILIDRQTNNTVAAGMIIESSDEPTNLSWQKSIITKEMRAESKNQKPAVIWLTGISGAGKSTVANLIEKRLHSIGKHSYILDGDNVRHGLNKDLGFSEGDRAENIRRVAETAKLMMDAGLMVIVGLISPFRVDRQIAREMFEDGEFTEVFLDIPIEVAERRDPKGLYKKARSGEIKNFTGVDSAYESPRSPELSFRTDKIDADTIAEEIIKYLD